MADQEDEIESLREKNNLLVQEVQRWKVTAAQRENEKLELMKEINELRLKVIRLKSGGAADARKLETALQSASEQALSHLVHASSAVARTIELAKTYMRDREGPDVVSPRWSSISNSNEKVHRVPPMMGGQSIQPVVAITRATLNFNTSRETVRSPTSNPNPTFRALPMHMLQDVYIPLTRIDVRDIPNNVDTDPVAATNDSGENIPFDSSMEEAAEDLQNVADDESFDASLRLDIVTEDPEREGEEQTPPRLRNLTENPLEGPSWLLDVPRPVLEPDSTTEETPPPAHTLTPEAIDATALATPEPCRVFAPTLRRRKRTRSPPHSPARDSLNSSALCSRVLQVLLPKLPAGAGGAGASGGAGRAGGEGGAGAASPSPRARRAAPRFDAPSPNGATDSRVIVSEELETQSTEGQSGEPSQTHQSPVTKRVKSHRNDQSHTQQHESRQGRYRRDSGDSDSSGGADRISEGRTRRNRKPVTYKEIPLNWEELIETQSTEGQSGEPSQTHQSPVTTRVKSHRNDQSHTQQHESRQGRYRRDSGDSDSSGGADRVSEGRTRRNRKPVTYKEKPLNRKLRR